MKTSTLACFSILVLAVACGGGDSPTQVTTTTTTSIPTPSSSIITMDVVDYGLLGSQGAGALFGVRLRIEESAGLGANINFIRLEVFTAEGAFEERSEVGANDIVNALGTNRLDANSTWEETVAFFFRATIKRGRRLVVTADLTDDKGNSHVRTQGFIFT